jgi:hypothetical protein
VINGKHVYASDESHGVQALNHYGRSATQRCSPGTPQTDITTLQVRYPIQGLKGSKADAADKAIQKRAADRMSHRQAQTHHFAARLVAPA